MAEQFLFELVTPERLFLSAEVDHVLVPGAEGDFGVMAKHAPMLSTLRLGILQVDGANIEHPRVFVRGGFAEITPRGLTVLAEEVIPMDEVDASVLDQQIKDLEEDFADAKDNDARIRAGDRLSQLRQVRDAL